MATEGRRQADQSAIWDEIALKSEHLGAASPTQAMNAIYDSTVVSVDAYLRAFVWAEHQAGLIFAMGPEVMGLDLMDHPDAMRAMLSKLVRSYALDAVEAPHSTAATAAEAAAFLQRISKAKPLVQPAVGIGEDVRLTAKDISGAALWAERRYVHLCAFSANGTGGSAETRTRISRPTARRA